MLGQEFQECLQSHIILLTGEIRDLMEEKRSLLLEVSELRKSRKEMKTEILEALTAETQVKHEEAFSVLRMEMQELQKEVRQAYAASNNSQKLPRFRQEDDPIIYITQFELICESNNWSYDVMCKKLPTCLPPALLPWYKCLNLVTKQDYHKLKEAFLERTSLVGDERKHYLELCSLDRTDFPSLITYVDKVEELSFKLGKSEKEVVDSFINRLPARQNRWTSMDTPKDLKTAVRAAEHFELIDAHISPSLKCSGMRTVPRRSRRLQQKLNHPFTRIRTNTFPGHAIHPRNVEHGKPHFKYLRNNSQYNHIDGS